MKDILALSENTPYLQIERKLARWVGRSHRDFRHLDKDEVVEGLPLLNCGLRPKVQ